MSSKQEDGVLLFDLYNWTHVSDGSSYVWKNDNGHTVEAEYESLDNTLSVVLRLSNGHVEQFPPTIGFQPANTEEIRRHVEDVLAGASGRW